MNQTITPEYVQRSDNPFIPTRGNRKSTVAAAKRLEKQLRDAARDLENLVHVLGHELRSSLSTIALNAELIELAAKRGSMPDMIDKSIGLIKASIRTSTDFLAYVDQMAVFQVEGDELQEVSLDAAIEEVLEHSEVSLEETATRVNVPQRLPNVLGESVAINRVLQNLFDNAVKYRRSDRSTTITITAAIEGSNVVVQVQDTGRGISENQVQKVFEPAWRGSNVGETPGRGLGLAFCHRIMERLEGAIDVSSEVDIGTRITLTFRAPPNKSVVGW